MRTSTYCFFLLLLLSTALFSCEEDIFKPSEQNPAPFLKQVEIANVKTLWKGNDLVVPQGLYIEGVVISTPELDALNQIHVQDKAGSGIVIQHSASQPLPLHTKLRIDLSGKKISQHHEGFYVEGVTALEALGTEVPAAIVATAASANEKISLWHSSLVTIKNVTIKKLSQDAQASVYSLTDATGTLKAYIADASGEALPAKANFVTGYLSVRGGNEVFLNLRSLADIEAVKPPEYKLFSEDFEKGVFNQVANFNEELGSGSWHFNQAFAAQGANDLKNGARSARISGKENDPANEGYVSPNFDYRGLRSVSFFLGGALWGEGGYLEDLRKVDVFISKDKGQTWMKIGDATVARGEFKKFELPVEADEEELVRVKIQNASIKSTATGNRIRINIDDITCSAISKE
ncbi:DUF5689 domain-containing protein [Rufibacter immobilis]|uniref:DUF5689 domain-containing protein n=1 Tax=Rufibacter immobilis TaxID=1348778 RepID=UPI0035EEF161